jgi:two-component system NtrC family sensor kinase
VVVRDITERKKAEEALRDAKEHYSALVENLADGVFQFREGVITWCNSAVEAIYGYSRDELIGMEASGFFPEEEEPSEYTRRVSVAIRSKGVFRDTRTIRDKNSVEKEVEYSVSQIPDRRPVELVAIVRDITERKRMEEALRESEEQYSALVGNIADAVFSYRDGKMLWVNDTIEQILGYSQQEIVGLDANLFVSEDTDLTEVVSEVGTGIKQKGHFHGTTKAKKKDGTVVDIEFTTSRLPGKSPPEIVGVARDVTERKKMERALKESEEHYRLLFESRLDGVFVIDAENLSVLLANQVVAEMYGFESTGEVVGLNPLDFVHPDDRERALNSIVKDMFEEEKNEIDEFRSITRDGREIWVSTIGTKMEYAGRIAGLVSIRDITNQKRAETEKQELEQQLQLTGRLAAVGELAAGVAHELNNPLAAVQAFAQLLSAKKEMDGTTKDDLETIYREAQRATRITGNLLSFARRHKPEKQLVDINDVLEKSIELHAYRMRVNNIDLVMDLDRDLPRIMADFHQMQQVFVNIITNAEQAMTETYGRGRLCATTRRSGEMIQVRFADDGPGMSEEDLHRVFDPFYTTKEVGKGTGLGLSICYGIVQEHGGNLTATSKLGEGATFTVEILIVTEARHARGKGSARAKEG